MWWVVNADWKDNRFEFELEFLLSHVARARRVHLGPALCSEAPTSTIGCPQCDCHQLRLDGVSDCYISGNVCTTRYIMMPLGWYPRCMSIYALHCFDYAARFTDDSECDHCVPVYSDREMDCVRSRSDLVVFTWNTFCYALWNHVCVATQASTSHRLLTWVPPMHWLHATSNRIALPMRHWIKASRMPQTRHSVTIALSRTTMKNTLARFWLEMLVYGIQKALFWCYFLIIEHVPGIWLDAIFWNFSMFW